jgi:arylsulfatase A-like enzyme
MHTRTELSFCFRIASSVLFGALSLFNGHSHAFTEATDAIRQPNVLVIMTDDQGYGDLSYHGNTMLTTPNLDKLASESLRMTDFHVEPTCSETRAALMTGRYPISVGVWHTIMGRSLLDAKAVTLPELFRAAGYRTGMFGKWHLGDNYPYRPHDRGFDTTLHHGGGGVGQTPDVWGNAYFDDVYWSGSELQPVRGYCTDVFFDAASQFIQTDSAKPFFCYLATNAPHSPYLVEQAYRQTFLDKGVPEPMASFYGMIANIDMNVGKLLSMLSERELDRETVVVFLTDNGTAAGVLPDDQSGGWRGFNAGMRGTKGQAYDGGHRVPCFIRFPGGLHAGKTLDQLTAHIDLFATLVDLCHLPKSSDHRIDGQSLLPLLNEGTASSEAARQGFTQRVHVVQSQRVEIPRMWTKSAVMRNSWRLIEGKELYDVSADPAQQQDISEQHPAVVQQLRDAYEAWWMQHVPDAEESLVRIPLGAPQAEVVRLTAHDWHGPNPPWHQGMVREQPATNGRWAVRVEQPGTYLFWLCRRPLEEPMPLGCSQVSIQLGEVSRTVNVHPTSMMAPITLQLMPGEYWLSTELKQQLVQNEAERSMGAFFVYTTYLGKEPTSSTLPEWLHAGDRVAWVGGTLIERAQLAGSLEASLLARAPLSGLTFCNLGWSGDDVRGRARNVFGDLKEGKSRRLRDLDLAAPSVVVVAYGMSEALTGTLSPEAFRRELQEFVQHQTTAGRRVVLCRVPELLPGAAVAGSTIDWEAVVMGYNRHRQELNSLIEKVAETLPVIDLPALRGEWFETAQYVSPEGYRAWSETFANEVFEGRGRAITDSQYERVASLSMEAHRVFFDMHRPQNETYLTLFRKHEQGNNAVETLQNRPLLAELQLQMLQAAVRE